MRRLSASDAEQYRQRLMTWLALTDVSNILNKIRRTAGFYAVSQGRLQFWREAQIGLVCARATDATAFRLGEDPPDFQLRYGKSIRSFEAVDVMPSNRRRGDEYDRYAEIYANFGTKPNIRRISEEELHQDSFLVADFERGLQQKVKMNYPSSTILVADVSHWILGSRNEDLEQTLMRQAENGLDAFLEIWIHLGSVLLIVSRGCIKRIVLDVV